MTSSARIIWALFIKNNQQQGQMKGWLLITLMALIGIYDGLQPMSPFAWLGLAYWCVVLAIAAGAGSFSHDFKFNSIRFLEYLPIRRWHIWAANWLDGLLTIWIPVLLTIWLRVLLWPGDGGPPVNRYGSEFMQYLLMPNRWALLFGALAVTFCGFAVSAFFRVLIQKDSAVFVRAIGGGVIVLSAAWIAPVAFGCMPSLGDSAIPLFAIGALFSLASLYAFHMRWRAWGAVRSWLLVSLPCLSLLILCSAAILIVACMRWAKYEPRETDTVSTTVLDDNRGLLVHVNSHRSGTHAFHVDPASKRATYFGRDLTAPLQQAIGQHSVDTLTTELLAAESFIDPVEEFRRGAYRPPALGARQFSDESGNKFYVRRWQRTGDGESVVFSVSPHRGDGSQSMVFVADLRGHVQRRLPSSWNGEFTLTRDGRLLVENPSPDAQNYGDPLRPPPTFSLYNLDSPTGKRIDMPGHVIRIEPDLSAALCRKVELRDGKIHRAVVLYNLASGESTTLLGEDVFPVFDSTDSSKFDMLSHVPALTGRRKNICEIDHVKFCLDDFLRIVPFVRVDRSNRPASGLMLLDRSTGTVRELVPQEQLIAPATAPSRGVRFVDFSLIGLTADRSEIVFAGPDDMRAVRLSDGAQRVLARRPAEADGVSWELSADGKRVLVNAFQRADTRDETTTQIMQVWRDGALVLNTPSEQSVQLQWLNDRELILTDKTQIFRINADTGERTPIFSTDSAIAR